MASAKAFEKKLFETASEVWWKNKAAIVDYVQGKPSKAGMLIFGLEHCYFAANFPRWFGNIVGNCPLLDIRAYLIGNMYVEEVEDPTIKNGHYESMVDFAVGCGADRKSVYAYQPSYEMLTAVAYWDNISRTRSWLEAFAGIGGLEFLNNAKLAKMNRQTPFNSKSNFAKVKVSEKYMSHWEAGEAADQDEEGHGQKTIDILVEHSKTPEQQEAVLRAFRESLSVFRHVYNRIGERAFAADRKAPRNNKIAA
jgi:pyrroloquinoline quinone (PQQ) biosynthesis protein C